MSRRTIPVACLAVIFVLAIWMLIPEVKNGIPGIAAITAGVLNRHYEENGTGPRDLRSIVGAIQRYYRGYEVTVHREAQDLFLVEVAGLKKQRARFRRVHRKDAGVDIYEYVRVP